MCIYIYIYIYILGPFFQIELLKKLAVGGARKPLGVFLWLSRGRFFFYKLTFRRTFTIWAILERLRKAPGCLSRPTQPISTHRAQSLKLLFPALCTRVGMGICKYLVDLYVIACWLYYNCKHVIHRK